MAFLVAVIGHAGSRHMGNRCGDWRHDILLSGGYSADLRHFVVCRQQTVVLRLGARCARLRAEHCQKPGLTYRILPINVNNMHADSAKRYKKRSAAKLPGFFCVIVVLVFLNRWLN
ncbi:hypothetical protein [Vogesella sp. LIG4]|uniref:hypothetical protein n=1 Tax=Vogesella sp. LIG4 TaxID=1192162 RepID=UPI0012FE62A6|nr:hypothetical protein [Vogesella sp. LIG4]